MRRRGAPTSCSWTRPTTRTAGRPPVPYNLIELTAAPPSGASTIGNTSDWLRMVFTHEVRARRCTSISLAGGRPSRARVFGRAPFAFPNLTLPLWQIEGHRDLRGEPRRRGPGPLRATSTRSSGRRARADAFEPLDRVNGASSTGRRGTGGMPMARTFMSTWRGGSARRSWRSCRGARRGGCRTSAHGVQERSYGASLGSLWRDFAREEARRKAGAPG